jgi:hypothetical protein
MMVSGPLYGPRDMYSSSLAQVSPASRMEGNELRQNRALAGTHMPWKWRFLNRLLTKGSGSTAGAPHFSAICRTFSSGGTRIRTGDTMIFRHMQKPLGMRQILIDMRIYVHGVPLDTTWFCPYCCATVDTSSVISTSQIPVATARRVQRLSQVLLARDRSVLLRQPLLGQT